MFRLHILAVLGITTAFSSGWARGSIIVDQPPDQNGGPAADTSFYDQFGIERWQELADDVFLIQPVILRRIVWHGFYGPDQGNVEPPPVSETMRVRIYDDAAGLPSSVLYEELFLNPSRIATGQIIYTGPAPPEQQFQIDLASPFTFLPNTRYWLSISQMGDANSHFRWETSSLGAGSTAAFRHTFLPSWQLSNFTQLSFQLSNVPEPGTLVLIIGAVLLLRRRGIYGRIGS